MTFNDIIKDFKEWLGINYLRYDYEDRRYTRVSWDYNREVYISTYGTICDYKTKKPYTLTLSDYESDDWLIVGENHDYVFNFNIREIGDLRLLITIKGKKIAQALVEQISKKTRYHAPLIKATEETK